MREYTEQIEEEFLFSINPYEYILIFPNEETQD